MCNAARIPHSCSDGFPRAHDCNSLRNCRLLPIVIGDVPILYYNMYTCNIVVREWLIVYNNIIKYRADRVRREPHVPVSWNRVRQFCFFLFSCRPLPSPPDTTVLTEYRFVAPYLCRTTTTTAIPREVLHASDIPICKRRAHKFQLRSAPTQLLSSVLSLPKYVQQYYNTLPPVVPVRTRYAAASRHCRRVRVWLVWFFCSRFRRARVTNDRCVLSFIRNITWATCRCR